MGGVCIGLDSDRAGSRTLEKSSRRDRDRVCAKFKSSRQFRGSNMKPKKKSRRCRGLGLDSGLDLAISRFIYSLVVKPLNQKVYIVVHLKQKLFSKRALRMEMITDVVNCKFIMCWIIVPLTVNVLSWAIQWYHFQADLIWPDATFKKFLRNQIHFQKVS